MRRFQRNPCSHQRQWTIHRDRSMTAFGKSLLLKRTAMRLMQGSSSLRFRVCQKYECLVNFSYPPTVKLCCLYPNVFCLEQNFHHFLRARPRRRPVTMTTRKRDWRRLAIECLSSLASHIPSYVNSWALPGTRSQNPPCRICCFLKSTSLLPLTIATILQRPSAFRRRLPPSLRG